MSRQTFGCECFLRSSASRLASSRAALSAQRISLITTNSRVDLSRQSKARPNAPAPSWSTTVNWSICVMACAPAAAGSLFAAGRAVAPAHDGAAFWLVRVDGAGPTDRRGAVRVPCESWAVRLSSLGVDGRAARCATRTKKPPRLPHKAHITPPACTSTPRPACRSPHPSLQDSPAAPRPSDGRRRDSAQPRPCPTPPSSPGPATSLTT